MTLADILTTNGSNSIASSDDLASDVNLDPFLSVGWLNLGNSLYLLGSYQASINAYNAALKLEPRNANALSGKNKALLALNRWI